MKNRTKKTVGLKERSCQMMKTHRQGVQVGCVSESNRQQGRCHMKGGGHMECRPSTLHPAQLEGNTGCLVVFGRSLGSRYTMFVKAGHHHNHHDHAFVFVRFCVFHSGHLQHLPSASLTILDA